MKRILGLTLALSVLTLACGPFALAHWPGQPEHQFANLGDLQLELTEVGKLVGRLIGPVGRGKRAIRQRKD